LIDEAGIGANVRFTGYQADPAGFVSMMSIVIHASIVPEPFGMVVLEAMAQRKPVIGSRAGGVVEMVVDGETGYTFPPGHHATLARGLIGLLNVPDRARRMGEAGYRRLVESLTILQYTRAASTRCMTRSSTDGR
jgi:glycosyltransferase involved in cell wall biosynthesis